MRNNHARDDRSQDRQARHRRRRGGRRCPRGPRSSRSAPPTSASTSATTPRTSGVVTHYFACTAGRLPRLALGGHRGPRAAPEDRHRRRGRAAARRRGDHRSGVGALPRPDPARRPQPRRPAAHRGGRPAAGPRLPRRRPGRRRRRPGQRARGRRRARPRPRPGAVPRGPRPGRRALVRRQPRSRRPRWPSRPRRAATRAGSWCGWPDRCRRLFGVCANAHANDDGRVVSCDHGCGAHSEAQLAKKSQPPPLPEPVLDTLSWDELEKF